MAFLRCLETLHTSLASVSLPLLILHGDNDSLCQPAGSHLLARWVTLHSTNIYYILREASSKDKKIKTYPGASHHLILEVVVLI